MAEKPAAVVPHVTEKMIARKDGPIGWIVFNNPARRNAVSLDMWRAIPVVLDDFESDPAIRVVVLRGAGDKAFVSGADISEFEAVRADAEAVRRDDEIAGGGLGRPESTREPALVMI